jgi:hypothetical protein
MTALALLALASHVAMAAVELPALWGKQRMRGELWTVVGLLLLSTLLAVFAIFEYKPVTPWKVIEAIFKPIGTLLFKAGEG